jgi:hypothetical protein
MQTFVPYADFAESAVVLDNKRLNKQLLEGRQILGILATRKTKGAWVNHPAVKMWRNHEVSLFEYLEAIRDECIVRGIQTEKNWNAIIDIHNNALYTLRYREFPLWWNDERVHQSHRNNLYRKDNIYYGQFSQEKFVSCCDKCNYFWPTHTLYYNSEFMEVTNV